VLKKKAIHAVAIGYIILLTVGSLAKINHQSTFDIEFEDKIVHFLAYAILCFLVFLSLYTKGINKSLTYAALFSIIFGIILELLQSVTPQVRVSEELDVVANTLGILVMVAFINWKKQTLVKKLQTFM
jgi:VanZ family protein